MIKRKLLWWLIIVIVIAIGVSLLGDNHGHIIMVRNPYRIQFSFNFFLLLLVLGFFAMHYGLRLMGYFKKLPAKLRAKKEIKALNQTQVALVDSVDALLRDDYKNAVRSVKKAQGKSDNPAIAALLEKIETKRSGEVAEIDAQPDDGADIKTVAGAVIENKQ